jgi:hypothetical protein
LHWAPFKVNATKPQTLIYVLAWTSMAYSHLTAL